MLSLLPSAASAAVTSSSVQHEHQRHPYQLFHELGPNSMGGNSGPTLPRIPPLIMPPHNTATTAASSTAGNYSPPSPRLYPSPYSPAGVPYFPAQNATSAPSSTAAAPNYYFPFNPYSRHYVQIDPNYSAVALAAGLQNTSAAAAQLRPFPRTAPIFTLSPSSTNPSTSPSPTQYSVFPFPPPPPPHPLPLHPPMNTSTPAEHPAANLPFFAAPNTSPVRLTSISPPDDHRSPSLSPHHSSSSSPPGGVKNVNLDVTPASGTFNVRVSCSNNAGGGRDLSLKHRLLRPAAAAAGSAAGHPKSVNLPTNNVSLDHVVNKLRASTPKRQKSSSTSSSVSGGSSTSSRPPSSSQPPPTPTAPAAAGSSMQLNGGGGGAKLMYPAHFNKGSFIQLTDGELKRVEDLSTEDFVKSAEQSGNLQIDSSTVVRIDSVENDGSTVVLGFAVGIQKLQVSVEASLEHPFFVFGKGWSSCNPRRTIQRYSLPCHQLIVGDVCISLTHKQSEHRKRSSTTDVKRISISGGSSKAAAAAVLTKTSFVRGKRKRRWSESDAAECQIVPNSQTDAANNQRTINQSCK